MLDIGALFAAVHAPTRVLSLYLSHSSTYEDVLLKWKSSEPVNLLDPCTNDLLRNIFAARIQLSVLGLFGQVFMTYFF
jgi:hypothetical protein